MESSKNVIPSSPGVTGIHGLGTESIDESTPKSIPNKENENIAIASIETATVKTNSAPDVTSIAFHTEDSAISLGEDKMESFSNASPLDPCLPRVGLSPTVMDVDPDMESSNPGSQMDPNSNAGSPKSGLEINIKATSEGVIKDNDISDKSELVRPSISSSSATGSDAEKNAGTEDAVSDTIALSVNDFENTVNDNIRSEICDNQDEKCVTNRTITRDETEEMPADKEASTTESVVKSKAANSPNATPKMRAQDSDLMNVLDNKISSNQDSSLPDDDSHLPDDDSNQPDDDSNLPDDDPEPTQSSVNQEGLKKDHKMDSMQTEMNYEQTETDLIKGTVETAMPESETEEMENQNASADGAADFEDLKMDLLTPEDEVDLLPVDCDIPTVPSTGLSNLKLDVNLPLTEQHLKLGELSENTDFLSKLDNISSTKIGSETNVKSSLELQYERRMQAKNKKNKDKKEEKEESEKKQSKSETNADEEEPDFIWDEYLKETNSEHVPNISFRHVECSLQNCFEKGMRFEMKVKDTDYFWIVNVIMPCGQLLSLRYDGYGDDSSGDFWCDAFSADLHPLGWCQQHGKRLQPPDKVKEKIGDLDKYLTNVLMNSKSLSHTVFESKTGTTPVDNIKEGMRVEVQHRLHPTHVWPTRILENVGGRLLLRYDGMDSAKADFWLFYLNERAHPIGWGEEREYPYKPPLVVKEVHSKEEDWRNVLTAALEENSKMELNPSIFMDQVEIEEHSMVKGWKVEILHPGEKQAICPGTVTKIINEFYYIVQVDDLTKRDEKVQVCCHRNSLNVFPVGWCEDNDVKLRPPIGWPRLEFNWKEYMEDSETEAAPSDLFNTEPIDTEFCKSMKLEAANPLQPGQICAATVTRTVGNLLWVHLDSVPRTQSSFIVDVESQAIFPVGWCESNGYPLKPPRKSVGGAQKKSAPMPQIEEKPMTADEYRNATYTQIKEGESKADAWCPKIYFNHKCFSGPYLNKSRLASLPKGVGPGPVVLVLKEVLGMLINVAYKSSQVLNELQMDPPPDPNMQLQVLKAKYKSKSYKALVEICKTSSQIEDFCRKTCRRLECCPYLISPRLVGEECPEACDNLTKTKYTFWLNKKKKKRMGRPPLHQNNSDNGGLKRKRGRPKRIHMDERAKRNSDDSDDASDDNDSVTSDNNNGFKPVRKKRRYQHRVAPPLEIKTRGVKLPSYSHAMFDRRGPRKGFAENNNEVKPAGFTPEKRKPGRPPKKRSEENGFTSYPSPIKSSPPSAFTPVPIKFEDPVELDTNPLYWSVEEVITFIKTTDCAGFARVFKEQEIDGQALLLLSLPTVQEHLELRLGPAVKLCHQVERVKMAFFTQFA